MPNEQTGAATPESADALIDSFLDVSDTEDTQRKARRSTETGRFEKKPPKEEPDDAGDDAPDEGDEEGEDTVTDEEIDGRPDEDQSPDDDDSFVQHDGRVKLSDGSVTTVSELVKGNLRMADYTRKTQETRAIHQELATRAADYVQQDQIVQLAIDIMAAALPPEPDARLLQPGEHNDPIAFTNQKLRWEEAARQLQAMQQAKQAMDVRNQNIQGTLLKQYALVQKDRLLEKHPELTDRKKLDAYHADLVKTLKYYGKNENDLAQVFDADIILMVEDLGVLRKIRAQRKIARQKTQGVAVLAPSTRQSASGRKARSRSSDWAELRKTGGKGASGAAALDRIFDDLIN